MQPIRRLYNSGLNPTPMLLPNARWKGDPTNPANIPDQFGQPRYVRDADFYAPLKKLGFLDAWFVGNGTLNQSPMWAGQRGDPSKLSLDWSKQGNFSVPPTVAAVQACAQLAADPTQFGRTGAFVPVLFDIECALKGDPSDGQIPMYWGNAATPAHRREVVANMVSTVEWARQANGASAYYWWGMLPPPFDFAVKDDQTLASKIDMIDASLPLADVVDGIAIGFYAFSDGSQQNIDVLISRMKEARGLIRAHYPQLDDQRIATLDPAYPSKQDAPIPLSDWKKVVDVAIGEGWDVDVFSDLTMVYDAFAPHCEYLARKAA